MLLHLSCSAVDTSSDVRWPRHRVISGPPLLSSFNLVSLSFTPPSPFPISSFIPIYSSSLIHPSIHPSNSSFRAQFPRFHFSLPATGPSLDLSLAIPAFRQTLCPCYDIEALHPIRSRWLQTRHPPSMTRSPSTCSLLSKTSLTCLILPDHCRSLLRLPTTSTMQVGGSGPIDAFCFSPTGNA